MRREDAVIKYWNRLVEIHGSERSAGLALTDAFGVRGHQTSHGFVRAGNAYAAEIIEREDEPEPLDV